ncbi:MAG TPA: cyclic nucleotide-binding domain-containing protein, partial [Beijerinckiaceae bacterium]|nr:cyclic nucleotide-binding domain-containing protein [Beijerinckiaceae bacterium]
MPNSFDAANPPFDRLSEREIDGMRDAIDIGYFRPGEYLITAGEPVESLFVIIKGEIEELDGDDLVALLGRNDSFDTRATVQGKGRHAFRARSETLAYLLPNAAIQRLIADNPRFGAFFYLDISRKLEAMAREEADTQQGSLMRTRVRDLFLQPAEFIDAADSIETAGHRMRDINSNTLLVRDG